MKTNKQDIMEDILKTITGAETPEQSLSMIVKMVAETFTVDVCSVYVYDPYGNSLILKATIGLNPMSVNTIEMSVSEGLTGMVIESMEPVFLKDPLNHPRFKYYENSGEENYQTYLGLPLIYHQKVLGALVIQTLSPEGVSTADIPDFINIARQISATVAFINLASRKSVHPTAADATTGEQDNERPPVNNLLRGEPTSDRVDAGYAHIYYEKIDFDQIQRTKAQDILTEKENLKRAFEATVIQVQKVADQAKQISNEESAIIEAQLMYLSDQSFREKIFTEIQNGYSAAYALKTIVLAYVQRFDAMKDPYLRERAADILDIGRRILGNLLGVGDDPGVAFEKETIIVASDLPPVDLMAMRQPNLKGVVLAKGGKTSHTVIIAKSFEIPIIIGVDGLFNQVRKNDYLIVDGVSGIVYINPESEIKKEFDQRKAAQQENIKHLETIRDLPSVTQDGFAVRLGANIGLLSDIMLAHRHNADHIGLYRTEFPFLLRNAIPTEDEQVVLYKKVLEKAQNLAVTIRTFDVGGDKFLSHMEYPKEENPFLGWRSIRISLDMQVAFRSQIRAILRVSRIAKVQVLFPMITTVNEIRQVRGILEEEMANLTQRGYDFDSEIKTGIMVEVPAAVPILDRLLRYVDFASIGTNDLIQYLLAVDRNNKKLAKYYSPLHPAVIATIYEVIKTSQKAGKEISICGEAATRSECLYLYLGMGATAFSMTPGAILKMKQVIRGITRQDAENALKDCLAMEDQDEIVRYFKARGILQE